MARASDVDVVKLVDIDSDVDLDPFIEAANELVTELCTDSGYTAARLKKIESWLAAHLYQMREQAVAMERAGSVQVQYQYKIGLNFFQTKYGQTAMLLDTSGNLAALSKQIEDGEPPTISFTWLGTDLDTEDDDD